MLQQIFDLLTSPPGNLIFHLVTGFAVIAALQATFLTNRSAHAGIAGRLFLGMGLLFIAQIGLFIFSGLAWQGLADLRAILPPLDRTLAFFSLLLIIWLWAFAHPSRLWDGLVIFIVILCIIGFLFSLTNWSPQAAIGKFNGSLFDQVWQTASSALGLSGIILLIIRRPVGWGTGLAMLILLLSGHAIQLIFPQTGMDLSGPVRLAQLCSFPLLPSLIQRFSASEGIQATIQPAVPQTKQTLPTPFKERRKHSADPRTVFTWLQLATQNDTQGIYFNLCRAVAQTYLADLCYLVSSPSQGGDLIVHGGYDLIRENSIPSTILSRDQVPTLTNAVSRGRAIRLGGENAPAPDLLALAKEFGLEDCGNLLLLPLATPDLNWGAVILLTPYSNRVWSAEDQTFLLTSIDSMVQLLQKSHGAKPQDVELTVQQNDHIADQAIELIALRDKVEGLQEDNQLLLSELAAMRDDRLISNTQPTNNNKLYQEALESIQVLRIENQRLAKELSAHMPGMSAEKLLELDYYENELHHALEESARLQNALAEANIQILELQKQADQPIRTVSEDREVLAAIAQELRQPMATITGYTELMLSESAGILGTLQRKFLERVKGSSERMRSMLDELIRLTNMQNVPMELIAHPLDAASVIDRAIADTRAQLQEKSITMQIELDEDTPSLYADQDAFYQIVIQLLQNAVVASPYDGTIHLHTGIEGLESHAPHFLFQIKDNGGGIDPKDLQRVFTRRYRAENALIQGVGDSGVGLSIVKTLVEAHNGRIWVDTQPGQSTTFSFLLPIRMKAEQESPTPDETPA